MKSFISLNRTDILTELYVSLLLNENRSLFSFNNNTVIVKLPPRVDREYLKVLYNLPIREVFSSDMMLVSDVIIPLEDAKAGYEYTSRLLLQAEPNFTQPHEMPRGEVFI